MKTLMTTLAMTAALATPALAGSLATPLTEPTVPAPVIVAAPAGGDWTGAYGGLQLGYGQGNATGGLEGDGVIGGLTFGYDYDFGQFVLGAGLDYDITDIDLGGATTIENVVRLKLRAGYDLGQSLVYVSAGGARADTSTLGNDTGWFAGAGYEYRLTESLSLGGEVLYHQFDDFNGSGADVDATTVQIRALFRF
jgi:opacity protein-like surface antigen